jgi:hypothetical protein
MSRADVAENLTKTGAKVERIFSASRNWMLRRRDSDAFKGRGKLHKNGLEVI